EERTGVNFSINSIGGDTYIVPSDVAGLVGAQGVLDRELFNVTELVEAGLTDADSTTLPLIIQHREDAAAPQLEGLDADLRLGSIDAVSAELDKTSSAPVGDLLAEASTRPLPQARTL